MRQQIVAFVAVTIPLVLTPGIATTLVLRTSLLEGTSRGLVTALGAALGSVCYGLASAVGAALVLAAWPRAVLVLRLCGGAYLAWLGSRAAWRSWREPPAGANAPIVRTGFREGVLANVLNPPVALFYFLILPGFVPRGVAMVPAVLLLTSIHVALAFAWHSTCAAAAGAMSGWLARTSARRGIDLITGVVLIVFAVRMLVR